MLARALSRRISFSIGRLFGRQIAVADTDNLLLENGDALLLENGDKLLLE